MNTTYRELRSIKVCIDDELADKLQRLRKQMHPTSKPASDGVLGHFLVTVAKRACDTDLRPEAEETT